MTANIVLSVVQLDLKGSASSVRVHEMEMAQPQSRAAIRPALIGTDRRLSSETGLAAGLKIEPDAGLATGWRGRFAVGLRGTVRRREPRSCRAGVRKGLAPGFLHAFLARVSGASGRGG